MKNLKKIMMFFVTAVALMMMATITAFAADTFSANWYQEQNGTWKIKDGNGTIVTNAWLCDDAIPANGKDVWYLLDANGNMISAGLVQDGTGNYYSLETNHNGYYGMLRYKSGTYDGVYLELESSHNGSFAAIKNADGIEALKTKYGLTKVNINNSNIVYTSSFNAPNASVGVVPGNEDAILDNVTAMNLARQVANERGISGDRWIVPNAGGRELNINGKANDYVNISEFDPGIIRCKFFDPVGFTWFPGEKLPKTAKNIRYAIGRLFF